MCCERDSGGDSGEDSNANALSHVCCRQVNAALTLWPDCDCDSPPCAAHLPQQTLPSWNSNLSVALAWLALGLALAWVWPGRFAALREIGYQSFCNLVCNLKFMKHIPLTQKMQANVCDQPCSSLAGSSSPSPTPLQLTLPAHCRLKLPFALFICLH